MSTRLMVTSPASDNTMQSKTYPDINKPSKSFPVAVRLYRKTHGHCISALGGGMLMTLITSMPIETYAQDNFAIPFQLTQSVMKENWLLSQMHRFRSYPHLDRAYKLLEQGKLNEAAAEMKTYLDIEPLDNNVRTSYFNVLYQQKNADELLLQTKQALGQNPENNIASLYQGLANQIKGDIPAALGSLRQVYLSQAPSKQDRIFAASMATDMAIANSRFPEALTALTTLASLQNNYSVHYRHGNVLAAIGRTNEAERAYEDALGLTKKKDEKIQGQSALGYLAQKKGSNDKAIQYGEAILALEPNNIEWLRNLSNLYYGKKNYQKAEYLARRALGVGNVPQDRIFLANVLAESKNHAAAIEQYTRIASEATDRQTIYHANMGLGYAYQAIGKQKEARRSFRQAALINSKREVMAALASIDAPATSGKDRPVEPVDITDLLNEYKKHPNAHGTASIGLWYARSRDPAKAAAYLEDAIRMKNDPEWRLLLAEQYAELKNQQKAEQVITTYTPKTAYEWQRLSEIYLKIGNREQALAAMFKGASTADARLRLSQQYVDLQQSDKALAELQILLEMKPEKNLKVQVLRHIGYIQLRSGDNQKAIEAFQSALAEGDNELSTRKELAFLFTKLGLYPQAMEQFLYVLEHQRTPQNMLSVARIYSAMKQTEPANRYYQMAEAGCQDLDKKELASLYLELGFLFAEGGHFKQAQQYWSNSAEVENTPDIQMSLAYAEEMRDMPKEALARLDRIAQEKLNKEQLLRLIDQYVRLHERSGNHDKAVRYLEQAIVLMPTAERHYQLALSHLKMEATDIARTHLNAAIRLAPQNPDYMQQLAYVCKNLGDNICAAGSFEQVLKMDPKRGSLLQDLAYTYSQLGDNEKAIDRLKIAIDSKTTAKSTRPAFQSGKNLFETVMQNDSNEDRQIYAMRQQVREMTRRYQFNAYQSYRANTRLPTSSVAPGFITGGLIPSQGGLEFLYQPDGVGYQDGRTFRVFGRTLWSNKVESLRIDSSTLQGGVGIEYKPLRDANVYVSLEKLIKFGSESENNWLARASWGYSDGYDMKPNQHSWNQTIIYADAGYFFQRANIRSLYAEARQGVAYNINNTTMVTPHVTLAGRGQHPDPFDASYLEVGAGISIKHLFNETRYEAARSSGELIVQYRKAVTGERGGSWMLTASLQY